MITVTVDKSKKIELTRFPKLMVNSDGDIVLFSSSKEGIVILGVGLYSGNDGEYADNFNMEDFTDFNSKVTLQNK